MRFKNPPWAARMDADAARGIAVVLSEARLKPYGLASACTPGVKEERDIDIDIDWIGPVARHGVNIVLCESLYPTLHMIEVALRNSVHNAFAMHFGVDSWFEMEWLSEGHAQLVQQAKDDLDIRKKAVTTDAVIAGLSFGFLCGMLHAQYERRGGPWPVLLRKVFPRVPKCWATREKIRSRVESVRWLRNRVFHHEPIAHLQNLHVQHRAMIELLGWLSADARLHVESLCRFRLVYDDRLSP